MTLSCSILTPRHGGDKSLAALVAQYGPLPKTRRARTGGGGEHLYFRLTPGVKVKNNNDGKLAEGVDVKTSGGYVAVPPSLHESGNRYAWIDESPAVEPPAWFMGLMNKASTGKGTTPEHWHETISNTIRDGTRNATMASIAGKLIRAGIDVQLAYDLLGCVNIARCAPPLPDAVIKRTVQSIVRTHVRNHGGAQ